MVTLDRVRVTWEGAPGLPGVSTFYGANEATASLVTSLFNFFNAIKSAIPAPVTIKVPEEGETIDSSTGQANGAWFADEEGGEVDCSGGGGYAAPAGFVVNWRTTLFVNGRKLRGKTFIVPVVNDCYQTDGSIVDTYRTSWLAAANTLVNTETLSVYSRAAGAVAPVASASIPDLVAVLRSRRP